MAAWEKSKQLNRALDMVRSVTTYNSLISICTEPEQILDVFESMLQQGVAPNEITYNAVISAYEKGSHPERALELFEAMQEQGAVSRRVIYD